MNRKIIIISLILLLNHQIILSQSEREEFDSFFYKFSTDSSFQIKRIQFPLLKISPDNVLDNPDSTKILEKDWQHNYFYFASNSTSRPQIYDSFSAKLNDTDERVFAWLGIETGVQIYYFFKRIEGTWYLIKIKDDST